MILAEHEANARARERPAPGPFHFSDELIRRVIDAARNFPRQEAVALIDIGAVWRQINAVGDTGVLARMQFGLLGQPEDELDALFEREDELYEQVMRSLKTTAEGFSPSLK